MKRNIIISLIIMTILFIPSIAKAKIAVGDIEMECIYDNGYVISAYYSAGAYGVSGADFKLSNALTPPYQSKLSFFYNEASLSKKILDPASCPSIIGYVVIKQTGDEDSSITFQTFFHKDDTLRFCNSGTCNEDSAFFKSKIVAGFDASSGALVPFELSADSPLSKRANIYDTANNNIKYSFEFHLVAERVYFNDEGTPENTWYFKSEGQQAASKPSYIKLSKYINSGNGTSYFVEKGNTITPITDSLNITGHNDLSTKFVCFRESTKLMESTKNETGYKFDYIRHAMTYKGSKNNEDVVEGNNGYTCPAGYTLYREVSAEEYAESEEEATSICDLIPETSLLLAKIINYLRYLVPAFLIILTAVDISKIVMTGNIDEELPKRKKIIITRFVIAVAFFFIPIFIQIFVSSEYGIDFGDVSCLF